MREKTRLAVLFLLTTRCIMADSISYEGANYTDVYVSETAKMYVVCFPSDGTTKSVDKLRVEPSTVVISNDAAQRASLYADWKIKNDALNAQKKRNAELAKEAEAERQKKIDEELKAKVVESVPLIDTRAAEIPNSSNDVQTSSKLNSKSQGSSTVAQRHEVAPIESSAASKTPNSSGGFSLMFLAALYFLPTIIAYGRKHHNAMAILGLNLLAGCTGIGWLIAFVWSLTSVPVMQVRPAPDIARYFGTPTKRILPPQLPDQRNQD